MFRPDVRLERGVKVSESWHFWSELRVLSSTFPECWWGQWHWLSQSRQELSSEATWWRWNPCETQSKGTIIIRRTQVITRRAVRQHSQHLQKPWFCRALVIVVSLGKSSWLRYMQIIFQIFSVSEYKLSTFRKWHKICQVSRVTFWNYYYSELNGTPSIYPVFKKCSYN